MNENNAEGVFELDRPLKDEIFVSFVSGKPWWKR